MVSLAPTVIHPTAVVDPAARLDQGVVIGPYCVLGPQVQLAAGTTLHSHVVLSGHTSLGRGTAVHPFAALGGAPQDRKYQNEPTELVIGDGVVIREHVTIHRGTAAGVGTTTISNGALIMAYGHVAHDCHVGRDVVMANGATLAGHVVVEDHAVLGGFAAVGQLLRVGESAMVAAGAMVEQDVPPYCTVSGDRAKVRALNMVGLKRRGFSPQLRSELRAAFRLLFRSSLPVADAVEKLRVASPPPEVDKLLTFVEQGRRGVSR